MKKKKPKQPKRRLRSFAAIKREYYDSLRDFAVSPNGSLMESRAAGICDALGWVLDRHATRPVLLARRFHCEKP